MVYDWSEAVCLSVC